MIQKKSSGNNPLIPALIGAGICLFLMRSGFFAIFFLVPLGFIGYGWGPKVLWPGFAYAFFGNSLITLGMGLILGVSGGNMAWDILFFTAMAGIFAWIILPPQEYGAQIPGAYRLAVGSCVCALVFTGLFFRMVNSTSFQESIGNQVELIASIYNRSENNILEFVNTGLIIDYMKDIMIRGGALLTSVFILFINRQISIFLVRLFGGIRRTNVFLNFHTDQKLLWVLCFSLLLLVLSSLLRITVLEIIFWNLVSLCTMMYLAQGLGILKFFLLKPNIPSFLRFLIPILCILLLFSPGINAVLLGILILLGVAENWISLRAPRLRRDSSHGPPSTPEA